MTTSIGLVTTKNKTPIATTNPNQTKPGTVYEYKYVVVNPDGRSAAAWQSGGNSVIALQWGDKEVEVYDNW